MTCAREPLSIEEIILKSLNVLAPADIKRATGKEPDWYYKASNPNQPHHLSMEDGQALDNLLAAKGFPRWFSDHWSRNTLTDDEYEVECLFRAYTKAGGAYGDLGRMVEEFMADGHLDEGEKAELNEAALRCEQTVQPFKAKGLTALDRRNGVAKGNLIRKTTTELRAAAE